MITAKFIGGFMDGEVIALKEPYPYWRFARPQPLPSYADLAKVDISKPAPIHQEVYERDGDKGSVVFYRHSKVATTIRRYYK